MEGDVGTAPAMPQRVLEVGQTEVKMRAIFAYISVYRGHVFNRSALEES